MKHFQFGDVNVYVMRSLSNEIEVKADNGIKQGTWFLEYENEDERDQYFEGITEELCAILANGFDKVYTFLKLCSNGN